MLNILPIPVSDIITYLNLGFLAIIIICAIVGFFRGTLKSVFFAIFTLIVFSLGWIFMGPASNALLNTDLSWIGITIPDTNIALTTPLDTLRLYLEEMSPEYLYLLEDGSYSLELIKGLFGAVFNIVFVILLVVLSFTVLHSLGGLLWLLLRKPLRKVFCKKKSYNKKGKPKYKKSFGSRFGGLGIGAVKGLSYTLIIGFILAGIASVTDSLQTFTETPNEEVAIVCTEDTFTFIKLGEQSEKISEEESNSFTDEYSEIIELFSAYHDTIPGKVFGSIKYGENKTAFDEYLFDTVFKIEAKNGSVKLRNELRKFARAFNTEAVQEIMVDGFDISKLSQLPDEDLKEVIDIIASLDLIKVVVPVGLELITYSDILEESLGDQYESISEMLNEQLPNLLQIDYCEEVKSLGYVFVDVLNLLGEDIKDLSQLDFFSLDQQVIDSMFASLNELEVLDIVAPIAVNLLINSEGVINAIEEAGFTIEDLGLDDSIDYVDELMNIPNIYKAIANLGFKMVEGTVDLSGIDPEKVSALTDAIFESAIISNALPVVTTTLVHTYMPDDYKDILTDEELESVDWKQELTPLLTAVAVLLKSDIINSEDPLQTLSSMEDSEFEELGKYLSQSYLLTNNLNEILEVLMSSMDLGEITFDGLDEEAGERWTEEEITSIFKCFKILINLDIFGSEDPLQVIKTMENEQIENISLNMSRSVFMKKNLVNIMDIFMDDLGFELARLTADEWTTNEIYSVFKSISVIAEMVSGDQIQVENFLNIEDDKLNVLLESKLIRDSLKKLLVEKSKDGEDLEILAGIYEDGRDEQNRLVYEWDDEKIPVTAHVNAHKVTIPRVSEAKKYIIYKNNMYYTSTDNSNLVIDLDEVENNSYEEEDTITVKAIVENGELRKVFNAISCLEIENINEFNLDLRKIIPNKLTIIDSYILTETLVEQIVLLDIDNAGGVFYISPKYELNGSGEWHYEDGELSRLIDGLDMMLSISTSTDPVYVDSVTADDISLRNIIDYQDIIFDSEVLSDTIVDKIVKLENDGILSIPQEYRSNYEYWNDNHSKEASYLLSSIDYIIDVPTEGFEITTDNIHIKNVITYEDEILKSAVLTATIVNKIADVGEAITIPNDYKIDNTNDSWNNGYLKWKNVYDKYGTLESKGELSHLLDSIDAIIGISTSSEEISISSLEHKLDEIYIEDIVENKEEILISVVITATISDKIIDLDGSGINVPSEYKVSLEPWLNEYDDNYQVVNDGEVSKLLDSAYIALGLSSSTQTSVDNLSINNVDLEVVTHRDNRDKVLYSDVLSNTLKEKIISFSTGSSPTIYIPLNYELKSSFNYFEWENEYDSNGEVITRGELSYILGAIHLVCGSASINDFSNLDFSVVFDTSYSLEYMCIPQQEILKSKVLSETIIEKLLSSAGSAISVPLDDSIGLNDKTDRSAWYNVYSSNEVLIETNELSHAINSLGKVLTDEQKNNLTGIDIYANIDEMLTNFKDDSYKNVVLKSYVVCETLKENMNKIDSVKEYIEKALTNNYGIGIDYQDRQYWYGFDSLGNPDQDKELWNLLTGASYILGDNKFTELEEFTISTLINNNSMAPSYNATTFEVEEDSHINKMLKSLIIEEIFAEIAEGLLTNDLSSIITLPSDGFNYYRKDAISKNSEYDLRTFLESFYLLKRNISNDNIIEAGNEFVNIGKSYDDSKLKDLGAAMVISRTFKNSISLMYNTLLGAHFFLANGYNTATLATWETIKFVQSDYDTASTKADAHSKFMDTYKNICSYM